jgi:hypothetical protein
VNKKDMTEMEVRNGRREGRNERNRKTPDRRGARTIGNRNTKQK